MMRVLMLGLLVFAQASFSNGPPINAETAFVTGLNGAAFRTFGKVVRKSSSAGNLTAWTMPIIFPYELVENKLVVGVGLPIVFSKILDLNDGTKRSSDVGIGDLTFFGKFNIFQQDRHQETFRVAGKIGTTFPTGTFGVASPQLGTGSVNPFIILIATKLWRRFGLNADVGYQAMTEVNGLKRGDLLRYDLAGSFRLLPWVYKTYPSHQLNLMLELNGAYTRQAYKDGKFEPNSGGNILFVSPGIQYIYDSVIVEASVQIPIPGASFVNGKQMKTDFAALLGIRWLIF
ncbi:MAG: transporter [Deltaproteobacteria bacterium]|nr:transporter [Deltaproteobacteria bacterium]